MGENLLTIRETMQALGISQSTLRRRLRSGELASVTRGGRRLVRLTMTGKASHDGALRDFPPFTKDHPIFRLMGAGRGGGQSPGARDKHAILDL